MKIGNHNAPAPAPAPGSVAPVRNGAGEATAASGKPELKTQPAGNASEGSATVKLSATASGLLAGSSADFDAEKVEKMRQAIASGTLTINAEAIADKLIANAQELLGKSSH